MANRYLRGTGARNWNDTANWSDTSGGAGGASVPTSADNVIFDANSGTGTITVNAIANMLDFTCSNIGALTLANAAYAFNVYGSLTLHTNLTVTFTSTGYLYMKATDSRTITTNGKVANWNRLYFDGVGGSWVNQDDMNVGGGNIVLSNGTYNTNDKTIIASELGTGAGTKIMTLGASVLNIVFYNFAHAITSNFTVNCGTSTINCSSYFDGAGKTYYTVNFINAQTNSLVSANTFTNLNFIPSSGHINALRNLFGNQTVTGTLTITGVNNTTNRLLIASNTIGSPRTITCNGTVTASNVDFRDITLAGTCNKDLSAITGGSGDCGGNSGIVFTTAQAQYFKKYAATANYGDAANWFSDTALTAAGRVPLPQDLGSKFLAGSFDRTCTVSCNVPRIPCLDMSEVANSVIWSGTNYTYLEIYGSFILGNNILINATNYLYFNLYGRGDYVINTFNKHTSLIVINSVGNIYRFSSDTNLTTALQLINSTIYLGNYTQNIYCNGSTRAIDISATVNLFHENSVINLSSQLNATNFQIQLGGKIFNKVVLSGIGSGYYEIISSNTIAELIIENGRKVRFTAGTTQTIAKLTAIGTPAAPITLESITAGSRFNLTYTGVNASTVEYCSIKDSKVNQARRLLAKNSTNAGNNQNWGFDTLPPFALNTKQVDKIYYGSNQVSAMYIGTNKIY